MASGVEELLDMLFEMIDEAKNAPLSSDKCVIERDRALDLIEENLKAEHGLTFFRADQCISRLEMESTCSLRRGVTYRFPTYFAYQ